MALKVWNRRDPKTPASAVYVGRPSDFGNRWSHDVRACERWGLIPVPNRDRAVDEYRKWLHSCEPAAIRIRRLAVEQLRGKDLVCWCVRFGGAEILDQNEHPACHAFPLMEVANA